MSYSYEPRLSCSSESFSSRGGFSSLILCWRSSIIMEYGISLLFKMVVTFSITLGLISTSIDDSVPPHDAITKIIIKFSGFWLLHRCLKQKSGQIWLFITAQKSLNEMSSFKCENLNKVWLSNENWCSRAFRKFWA